MSRRIRTLPSLAKEFIKLDESSRKLIYSKIQLIKENPYRFKKLHSNRYSRVFRVRFNLKGQDTRLVYVVVEPEVILVCLLDRGGEYKDLDKSLKKVGKELGI